MALKASEKARGLGTWPVGSVIVRQGAVVGAHQNEILPRKDITCKRPLSLPMIRRLHDGLRNPYEG